MSKEALTKVVQRAISDGAFRRQLTNDPTGALRGFDLTPNEIAAVRSGDSGRLSALGIDLRMSKAFTLAAGEGGISDSANFSVSSDLGASMTGATTTGGFGNVASSGNSLVASDIGDRDALIDAGDGARTSNVVPSDPANPSLVIPSNPADGSAVIMSGGEGGTFANVLTPVDTDAAKSALSGEIDAGGTGTTPAETGDGPNITP